MGGSMKNYFTFLKTFLLLSLLVSFVLIDGCQKYDNPVNNNNPETGNISGTVFTSNGKTLYGATISVGNFTAFSDESGGYFLKNIPVGTKVLVNFKLDNYTYTQKIVAVIANHTVTIDASLINIGTTQNFNASTGGSIQFNGAKVDIPANVLIDSKGNAFVGTATVKATYFDPSGDAFFGCFPGEFKGTRTNSTETPIESYGFISVQIFNGAEKLQLKSGSQANITIPVCAKLQGKAPQSIPLWYYDEQAGKWMEQGTATLNGNNYTGTVSHFTFWNADNPTETSYLTGKVVDNNGNPISLARIFSIGQDYEWAYVVTTLADGTFNLPVKASSNINVYAKYWKYSSTPQYYQSPAAGQTSDIGNLVINVDSMNVVMVIGRIIDNTGQPLGGVYVKLWDSAYTNSEYNPASHTPSDLSATNADGNFKMFGTTNKSYYVEILGYYFDTTQGMPKFYFDTGNQYDTKDLGDLHINVGGVWVTATVVDSSGFPMANINWASSEGKYPNIFGNPKDGVTTTDGKIAIWARPNITMWLKLFTNSNTKNLNVNTGNLGDSVKVGNITFP
jgi:protocatechuate 3,4-dioxygenase beta subunit